MFVTDNEVSKFGCKITFYSINAMPWYSLEKYEYEKSQKMFVTN